MRDKTTAMALVESLRDLGTKFVFGVPSGGWIDYAEAIRQTEGIDFILTSHEGGASFMAGVCGRLTGIPGVCFGTYGPGATNLSTGVGGAQLDRSPLIALTDEMPEAMRGRVTQMGIDHQALFAPITKWTTRLSPENASEIAQKAAAIALSERPGSVHIGMPTDVSSKPTQVNLSTEENPTQQVEQISDEEISAAQDKFSAARKPAIVLGLGAVRAGLRDEIIRFANTHRTPVLLTPMAKGMFPEDHDLYAGVLFHALSDQIAETHRQADLMLAVGYDPVEFNFESWMPNIPLINVDSALLDIDPAGYTDTLHMGGDIATIFAKFSDCTTSEFDWDIENLVKRKKLMFAHLSPKSEQMGPCSALDVLRRVLPEDGIMTCDVGAHTHLIGQKWRTPMPGTQLMTNGWSSMGFGLPAAIAAKLCQPKKSVCTVVGDGGLLMSAGEFATAVRYNLNVVTIVLTDNDLTLIRIKQERKDIPNYGTSIRELKSSIGSDKIFGVPVLRAHDEEELEVQLGKAFSAEGPVIVEAFVNGFEYDELVLKKVKAV